MSEQNVEIRVTTKFTCKEKGLVDSNFCYGCFMGQNKSVFTSRVFCKDENVVKNNLKG